MSMDISTDNSTGTKFGDLKKEQRYKRLERDLRLEYFKRVERLKADINKDQCTSPTWPSLSSINPDNLDSSCANGLQSLQVSRVESEVISSSSNLHKVFPVPMGSERLPMATSSVKHFPVKDYDKDRAIMPPPSTSNLLSTGSRRFSTLDSKHNEHIKTHDSSVKNPSSASCSSYQEDDFNTSQNSKHSRTFYRWKVLLNPQGQLIIKGTLDCGKIARSKPVIHRLSSTTVQSIYKHTYILNGPIVDEKEELPEYIRGKFHNGFPDDWENIHQLWTNYVSEGCKETFRWPTPITDSDDDLYSEITDFSYFKNKQIEYREQHSKFVANNGSSLGYHSRTQSDSNFNFEKSKDDKLNSPKHNKVQVNSKSIEDSGHSSEIKDSNACSNEQEAKNVLQESQNNSSYFSNPSLKNANFLSQIIKEDKLRVIMSNLGNENCPPQYLDKLIELSDCLRYILSYAPESCAIDCKKQDLSGSKSQVCEKCNNNTVSLVDSSQEDSLLKQQNKKDCVKIDSINKNLSKANDQSEHASGNENFKQPSHQIVTSHNSSDSDGCMGVPRIPVERLIQPKSPRLHRYKDKRSRNRERNDAQKNDQVESQMLPISNSKVLGHDDSSVSITEDEFERRRQEPKDHRFKEPLAQHGSVSTQLRNEENIKMAKATSFNDKGNENINTMNYKSNIPPGSSKTGQNLTEKQKPIIKSCEPAHYKLVSLQNVKNSNAVPPDITILSEEISTKNKDQLNSKNKNLNVHMGKTQEKLQKDIQKHPFLSYDSEDYFNEKEAKIKIELPLSMSVSKRRDKNSSIDRSKENSDEMLAKQENQKKIQAGKGSSLDTKKSVTSNKSDKNETFGSKNNPKLLTSWVPRVDYDKTNNKLSLKFEGKLLNERGHILHRRFITDSISQRHSSKLIETEKNEYFSLVGDISDTKHAVPKELFKQCSTGCPSKFQEFCEDWNKLSSVLGEHESVKPDNLHDASINLFNIPTSKRGRPIVPPLNFWNGERLLKKASDVVYVPGNTKESFLQSKIESGKKTLPTSDKRPQRNRTNKDVNLKGSLSSKPSKTKESSSDSDERHSPVKKRLVQQLTYSTNEESDDSDNQSKKFRKPTARKSGTNYAKSRMENQENKTGHENTRKRIKKNLPQLKTRTPRRSDPKYEWSYEKEECCKDMLSEDQLSVLH